MKKHYFSKIATCLVIACVLFFSCKQNNNPTKPKASDPSLGKLEKLTVHGEEVDMETWTVKVPYANDKVATGDVKATFKLEGYGDVKPEVNKSPVTLTEGHTLQSKFKSGTRSRKAQWMEQRN